MTSMAGNGKNLKNSKNLKKPQFTYKFFLPFFPIPVDPSAKMIPIVVLHSWTVKKNTKITHHDPQQTPSPFLRTLPYISLPAQVMHLILRQNDVTYPLLHNTTSSTTPKSQYLSVLPYLAVSKNRVFCKHHSTYEPGTPRQTECK